MNALTHRLSLLLLILVIAPVTEAKLRIEVTGGVESAQPIAVVPFGAPTEGAVPREDVAQIIAADLARSGRFQPMPRREMLVLPQTAAEVDVREWQLMAQNNLIIGQITSLAGGGFEIRYSLLDVFSGDTLLSDSVSTSSEGMRLTAHRIADTIYEKLTGQPGVFATRIAYITEVGDRVTLRVADADGFNAQTIVSSPDPIMSPAWSPDGRRLAYVSFENRQTAIYVQELTTGRRERVAAYAGTNDAPAFSPDGRQLAMSLSKDGNPEIYVLNLLTRQLTRITDHFAIDTEPSWAPDGSHLVFTSDRGGQPQVYRVSPSGGAAQRVSFQGDYNAKASYSADGRKLVMVNRSGGSFRILMQDMDSGQQRLLSPGPLDETPSFAPNGSMVIYATQHQGRGVLAATAINGGITQRLSRDKGQVREPAWAPTSSR